MRRQLSPHRRLNFPNSNSRKENSKIQTHQNYIPTLSQKAWTQCVDIRAIGRHQQMLRHEIGIMTRRMGRWNRNWCRVSPCHILSDYLTPAITAREPPKRPIFSSASRISIFIYLFLSRVISLHCCIPLVASLSDADGAGNVNGYWFLILRRVLTQIELEIGI